MNCCKEEAGMKQGCSLVQQRWMGGPSMCSNCCWRKPPALLLSSTSFLWFSTARSTPGGHKTIKEKFKAAKEMALDAFARLRQILPGFQPVNKDSICVGRLVVDAAAEFPVQLRKHFRDLPFTTGQRMLKCGWAETDLPAGSFKEQPGSGGDQMVTAEDRDDDHDDHQDHDDHDSHDEDDEDDDEDDNDTKMRFADGHIRHWWAEAGRLPSPMRPSFCLRYKFKDPFITFEERALPQIL
ncbi:MAG: hypothetical protein J3R72DRAFT_213803 [Linnemannia gamsii]|nr:MAG: hypothetical protein J3R72DRAFT_213803 [Linnemannia gamsii]